MSSFYLHLFVSNNLFVCHCYRMVATMVYMWGNFYIKYNSLISANVGVLCIALFLGVSLIVRFYFEAFSDHYYSVKSARRRYKLERSARDVSN